MAASSFGLNARRPGPRPSPAAGRRPRAEAPLDTFALLRDQVRGTFAFNRTSLAGHLVGAVLIVLILAGGVPRPLLRGWGALFAVVWLVRLVAGLALCPARAEQRAAAAGAGCASGRCGVLIAGALWGAAAWLFYPVRQRPAADRPGARRLHLLGRQRADPGAAVPALRRLRDAGLRAGDRRGRGPGRRRRLADRRDRDGGGDGDDRSSSAATTAPRSTASSP